MITQEKLTELIRDGSVPYLYNKQRGYLAVTAEILYDSNHLSGDVIDDAAFRAIIQIYERQLTALSYSLSFK